MRQRNIITYEQANYSALVQKLLKFQYANFCGFQYCSWVRLCFVAVAQRFTLYIHCSSCKYCSWATLCCVAVAQCFTLNVHCSSCKYCSWTTLCCVAVAQCFTLYVHCSSCKYYSWATMCCVAVIRCFTVYINCSNLHELLKMHTMNLKYSGKTATFIMRQKNVKFLDSWAPPSSFVKKKKDHHLNK